MRSLLLTLLVGLAALPATASAATIWKVQGRGFGHGVGMSQYGAYGYAQHGWTYDQILRHYYQGTALGSSNPALKVRVLVDTEPNSVAFTGASRAGSRKLDDTVVYTIRRARSGRVAVYRGSRWLQRFGAAVEIRGGTSVQLREASHGHYRAALRIGRDGSRLDVVNVVGLDNYVKGVVSGEMPSSWDPEALKAQAVAARTYAVATGAGDPPALLRHPLAGLPRRWTARPARATPPSRPRAGRSSPTTAPRSSPTSSPPRAGAPRTSRTSSAPTRAAAAPSPTCARSRTSTTRISPRHSWTFRFSPGGIGSRLGVGTLKSVKVLQRGRSPRIVLARFTGSRGTQSLYGSDIRSRLGTYDSWMSFYKISAQAAAAANAAVMMHGAAGNSAVPSRVTAQRHQRLVGSFVPGRRGARIAIQRRTDGGWVRVDTTQVGRGGGFAWSAPHAGTFRAVAAGGLSGPAVRLR